MIKRVGASRGKDAVVELSSDSVSVGVGVNSPQEDVRVGKGVRDELPPPPLPPPLSPPPKVGEGFLGDRVEYFKQNYVSVFGLDSVVPSSGEVLKLNLLFSIYSELVGLREDLAEIFSEQGK